MLDYPPYLTNIDIRDVSLLEKEKSALMGQLLQHGIGQSKSVDESQQDDRKKLPCTVEYSCGVAQGRQWEYNEYDKVSGVIGGRIKCFITSVLLFNSHILYSPIV